MTPKTLIIAEAGVNHNGDMALAKQLIDAAADAGADLVKFQTFNADRQVTQAAAKANYQLQQTDQAETQHAMLRRLELSEAMHHALIAHCTTRGIGFFFYGLRYSEPGSFARVRPTAVQDSVRRDHQPALFAPCGAVGRALDSFDRHGHLG